MDTQRHGRAELCATARSTARTVIDFQFLWMGAAPLSLPAMMATAVERRGNRSEAHVPPLSVSAGPNTSAIILGNPDRSIGINPSFVHISDLFSATMPGGLPDSVCPFVLLLILWKNWDSRNKKVLQALEIDTKISIKAIIDDVVVWSHRSRLRH